MWSFLAVLLFAARQASSASTPFLLANGQLLLEARIDSTPCWFIVDSGSPESVLDPSLFRKVRADSKKLPYRYNDCACYGVPRFSIGDVSFKSCDFAVGMPKTAPELLAGMKVRVGGILGDNLLRMLCVGVDFDAAQAKVWGPTEGEIASSALFGRTAEIARLPVIQQDGRPWLEMACNGRRVMAELDTGSVASSVPGSPETWFGDSFLSGPSVRELDWVGERTVRTAAPRQLDLAGIEVLCPPILLEGRTDDPPILGRTLLDSLHQVLFDFDGGVVSFPKPKEPVEGANSVLEVYGLELRQDHRIYGIRGNPVVQDQGIALADVSFDGMPRPNFVGGAFGNWKDRAQFVLDLLTASFSNQAPKSSRVTVDEKSGPLQALPAGNPPFSSYQDGPGVYLVVGAAPPKRRLECAVTITDPNSRLVAVGGVGMPRLRPGPRNGLASFECPASPALSMVAEPPGFTVFSGDGRTYNMEGVKMPICVPDTCSVVGMGGWIMTPGAGHTLVFYPSGWTKPNALSEVSSFPYDLPSPPEPARDERICIWYPTGWVAVSPPQGNDLDAVRDGRATKPPGPPPKGFSWLLSGGQWILLRVRS